LQNDHYTRKVEKIMSLKKENYKILLDYNFYILAVDFIVPWV